jgi:hypothetical protein
MNSHQKKLIVRIIKTFILCHYFINVHYIIFQIKSLAAIKKISNV